MKIKTTLKSAFFVGISFLFVNCAHSFKTVALKAEAPETVAPPPASPTAVREVAAAEFKLQAVPTKMKRKLEFSDVITLGGDLGELVFGTHPICKPLKECFPFLGIRKKNSLQIVDFHTSQFANTSWVYVAVSNDTKNIWAFLDGAIEGALPEIRIVRSQDQGKTWKELPALVKPNRLAWVDGVYYSNPGRLEVLASWIGDSQFPGQLVRWVSQDNGNTFEASILQDQKLEISQALGELIE